jgi:hypothetical protein
VGEFNIMATITLFTKFHEGTLDGEYALDTASDTYVCLLVDSSTPSVAWQTYADIPAGREVANGNGYTTGGAVIPNVAVSPSGVFSGDPVVWGPGATFSTRWGVIYKHSSPQYLIGYINFDSAVQTVTNGTFTISWNVSGILRSTSS